MSGGVDSSVSAALLVQAGYNVTGVFIKVWQPDWMECNWREDRLDAMRVAAVLDIPFVTLDLEKEYKREVVDYMIAEYRAGRTPNPDVMCNKSVKFGAFYDWAMSRGADFVATGHYAKIVDSRKSKAYKVEAGEGKEGKMERRQDKGEGMEFGKNQSKGETKNRIKAASQREELLEALQPAIVHYPSEKWQEKNDPAYRLLAGSDPNKDQSYFLWNIRREQLPHILFPIGDIDKPDVRKLARKFKLPNADKKDSQGLCFIGKVDIKEFLSHYMNPKAGDVLDESGVVVGHHDGAFFLTIGERHGFVVDQKTPHDKPYYIVAKDLSKNTVTVSNKDSHGLLAEAKTSVRLEKTNWMSGFPEIGARHESTDSFPYSGRARYRQPLEPLVFTSINEKERTAMIEFDKPQNALTPGQSLVVYDGEVCLGGGVII